MVLNFSIAPGLLTLFLRCTRLLSTFKRFKGHPEITDIITEKTFSDLDASKYLNQSY